MQQNIIEDYDEQQITKIKEDKQRAKMQGKKVVSLLSHGDVTYFGVLTTIRRVSLFLAICWGIAFAGCLLAETSPIIVLLSALAADTADTETVVISLTSTILVLIYSTFILSLFIFAIQAHSLRMRPRRLRGSFICQIVIILLMALLSFLQVALTDNGGIIFINVIPIIVLITSHIALSKMPIYCDWFYNYGGKIVSLSVQGEDEDIGEDDEYYDDEF